ncbi:hypothetical protein KKC87_04015, partial [Patescibacteria group bacterium]|nr:hypothetical protein [Patescibacteria group bacterium]
VIITYLYILKLHSFRIAQKALCDANHIESSFPGNLQQRSRISDVATVGSNMGEHLPLGKREPDIRCCTM